MGKAKNEKSKVGFFAFDQMRIKERLSKSYTMVLGIASIAAIIGVIAVFTVMNAAIVEVDCPWTVFAGWAGWIVYNFCHFRSFCRSLTRKK